MEERHINDIEIRKKELAHQTSYSFEDLLDVMMILRSENGCPWDKEQTHKSIRNNFIEETYEVIEAIDTENPTLLREELGDVMLQIVFHSRMEEEKGEFNIYDVCNDICKKLVHRHPHIFGEIKLNTSDEVLDVWDSIKKEEKHRDTLTSNLRSVPPMLPALMRAEKVGKKAKFFDFPDEYSVRTKIDEEICEMDSARKNGNIENLEEEIGDLLLTITSYCRKVGVHPEDALTKATNKFIDRFEKVENEANSRGIDVQNASMTDLDSIWNEIKHKN